MSLARESFSLIIFFSLCFLFYSKKISVLSYFFLRRFQNRKKKHFGSCSSLWANKWFFGDEFSVCPVHSASSTRSFLSLKLAIPSRQVEHRIYTVPRSVVDWRPDRVSSSAANVDFPWEEKQLGRWRGRNFARYLNSFLGPYGFPTVPYRNCIKCSFPFPMCLLLFFPEHW